MIQIAMVITPEVEAALHDMGADVLTFAGLVLGGVVLVYAVRFIRHALL